VKRIDIVYGGHQFSIADRDYDDLRTELVSGLAAGPQWLEVNVGEGGVTRADLLVTHGVPIALIPIPDEDAPTGE